MHIEFAKPELEVGDIVQTTESMYLIVSVEGALGMVNIVKSELITDSYDSNEDKEDISDGWITIPRITESGRLNTPYSTEVVVRVHKKNSVKLVLQE